MMVRDVMMRDMVERDVVKRASFTEFFILHPSSFIRYGAGEEIFRFGKQKQ